MTNIPMADTARPQGLQVMFDRRHPGGPGLHLR